MINYDNPWIYDDKPFGEDSVGDYIGFVYEITERSTGRKYLGKKIFHNKVAKPPLKGKTKRRISTKPSNWMAYYGSGPAIQAAVEAQGPAAFERKILRLCKSKSEMGYWEAKLIFQFDAILRDDYFNDWVSARVQRNQLGKYIAEIKANNVAF